jgi:hypothetical protein
MAMKIVKIILILLVVSAAINFVRGDHRFPLPQVLPFCGGHEASILYDLICGFGLIGLGIWGLNRLKHRNSDAQQSDAHQHEIYEAEISEQSDEQEDTQ